MTSTQVKTCHACGVEYSEIARMYSEFVRCHGANELWLQLIDAAAGVMAARERLAETLSCTDEEYVAVLARLEIMLDMAIRGLERDDPMRPEQDAWVHPGLAIALLIVEASKWARNVTDILSVWSAALNARQALDRLILPWDGMMAEARRSVAVELRLCRTCQVRAGRREL
ncbi:MAG: hypothetical protein Q7J24_15145 [Desulfomicrobium sp.]|nr:hypothetical protein [Desulfomicrobium sp.]